MSFAYIQNLRFPHEMAHSIAVVKAAEAAAALGHDTYLLHPRRTQTPQMQGKTIFNYYDLQHHFKIVDFPVPEFWNAPKIIQFFYKKLRHITMAWAFSFQAFNYARKNRIDVIQTGDREILTLIRLLSFLYKPKVIYDVHNDFADWYNLPLLKLCKNIITLAVANCDYVKYFLIKNGLSSKKIIVTPNGFDPKYYRFKESVQTVRKRLKLPTKRFIFGYVGRFETLGHEKGIVNMLKAGALAKKEIPITVLAVGGPAHIAREYRKLAKELGLFKDEAIIIDQVQPEKVAEYIYTFDVASLIYPDTFHFREKMSPMKAVEYLAAGKPIVASDFPTNRSILGTQANYLDPEKIVAIKNELIKLYNHTPESNKKIKERKIYISSFTWQNRQQRILNEIK